MNNWAKVGVFMVFTALSCTTRAEENSPQNQNNKESLLLKTLTPDSKIADNCTVKAGENPSPERQDQKDSWFLKTVTTDNKLVDAVIVYKTIKATMFEKAVVPSVFWVSAVVLRKASMYKTICSFVGYSQSAGNSYGALLVANPVATIALTAMCVTGAYTFAGVAKDGWNYLGRLLKDRWRALHTRINLNLGWHI